MPKPLTIGAPVAASIPNATLAVRVGILTNIAYDVASIDYGAGFESVHVPAGVVTVVNPADFYPELVHPSLRS